MSERRFIGILIALVATYLTSAHDAHARTKNVEEWVERGLSAYVATQLTEHPRFKGASVRFVVMQNGIPQSNVDALSLRLRDRLQRKVIDTPGVTIGWQANRLESRRRIPTSGVDCSADDVQYLIGMEMRTNRAGDAHLTVRALDVIEQTWVSGFGREWRGSLNREQRRALGRAALDPSYLGERGVPYDRTETDLMAAHLAHDLRCALMRQVTGEYVVSLATSEGGQDDLGILELVGNNVAGVSSLQFAVDDAQANALLEGQAHEVDRDLYQYWITVTPTDAEAGLQPLSTSVYVRLPETYLSAVPITMPSGSVSIGDGSVLDSLRLVRLEASRSCPMQQSGYGRNPYLERRSDCLGLEVTTRDDAVVFVLNHQQNNGLVRLDVGDCGYRTSARIARANEAITVPLPTNMLRDAWLPENDWQLEPDADTYYAIAVSDSKAARALASHLDKLPRRCSESLRVGYEGRQLETWLQGLASAVERWEPFVDWNAIRIKNVY